MPSLHDLRYATALRMFTFREVVCSWDFGAAMVVGLGGSLLLTRVTPDGPAHVTIASDAVVVLAALLGFLIAGFAILAALVGGTFAAVARRSGAGIAKPMAHFLFLAALVSLSLIVAIVFQSVETNLLGWNHSLERGAFGFVAVLALWSVLNTLQVLRLIYSIAILAYDAPSPDNAPDDPDQAAA